MGVARSAGALAGQTWPMTPGIRGVMGEWSDGGVE
jgi:hypothetical protein